VLPPSHYALAEQLAGGFGPDVLTLEGTGDSYNGLSHEPRGGLAIAEVQPKVSYRAKTEADIYATKANRIAIRHASRDDVVAVIEVVSPGNKSTIGGIYNFVEKAVELLHCGIHLLIVDPFPPSPSDPQGIHKAIWQELDHCDFMLPSDRPLTMVSYIGGATQEAFIEPTGFGSALPEMPVFLDRNFYVNVPLEATYQAAWEAVPARWQRVLE
jgi:hypothetical protein